MRILLLLCAASLASATTTVTVQETLWPGSTAGVTRSSDVYTFGLPLPDQAGGITCSNLTVTSGLFQCATVGSWPSGRPMWLRVDGTASMAAGGTATVVLGQTGSNVNCASGSTTYPAKCATAGAMGSDDGTTITVATGAATFTVKKSNYRIESATIGTTNLLSVGQPGLVLVGPVYPNTTCSNPPGSECTTVYSSANDSSSTAVLEENGPVKTVIRADAALKDSSGNVYMRFTQRLIFFKGATGISIKTMLRNADLALTSNTFGNAYKAYRSLEMRFVPALGGGKGFSFSNDTTTPTTGSFTGSEDAYLYQAKQDLWLNNFWSGLGVSGTSYPITGSTSDWAQKGYVIQQGASSLVTQTSTTAYPEGWADLHDGTGSGIQIGVYEMAQAWPASLEFRSGGTDVRIGLRPDQNLWTGACTTGISPCKAPVWQPWPHWKYFDPVYVNFHTSSQTSTQLSAAFLAFQHPLVARADLATYNASGVMLHDIPDPTAEDTYYKTMAAAAGHVAPPCNSSSCTILDQTPVHVWWWGWAMPSGSNQTEYREDMIRHFLQRGYTGRLLVARNFLHHTIDEAFPSSDGFTWTDYWSEVNSPGSYMTALGQINSNVLTRSNSAQYTVNEDKDAEHWYRWAAIDYYWTQGDEFMRDWLVDAYKDQLTVPWHYWFESDPNGCAGSGYPSYGKGGYGCHLWPERALGVMIDNLGRLEMFLQAIGDPITGVSCPAAVSGTPSTPLACDPAQLAQRMISSTIMQNGSWEGWGDTNRLLWATSPVRGYYISVITQSTCNGVTSSYLETFFEGILLNGLLEFNRTLQMLGMTNAWSDYAPLQERMFGMAQWILRESLNNSGGTGIPPYPQVTTFDGTHMGSVYGLQMNAPNTASCPDYHNQSGSVQNDIIQAWSYSHEYGDTTYDSAFDTWVQASITFSSSSGFYNNFMDQATTLMHEALSYRVTNPNAYPALVTVTPSSVVDNGGGSYTINWTPPANTSGYKLKRCSWAGVNKTCKDWLRFDWTTNTFVDDPNTYWPWFSSTSLTAPASGATTYTITGQPTGLTASNFALKAYTATPTCTITPLSAGPYRTGSPVSLTFLSFNCSASTWSYTGTLPPGLSFSGGLLSGTPTTDGVYSFTVSYSTASAPLVVSVATVAAPAAFKGFSANGLAIKQ